jgi:hypothetical protein
MGYRLNQFFHRPLQQSASNHFRTTQHSKLAVAIGVISCLSLLGCSQWFPKKSRHHKHSKCPQSEQVVPIETAIKEHDGCNLTVAATFRRSVAGVSRITYSRRNWSDFGGSVSTIDDGSPDFVVQLSTNRKLLTTIKPGAKVLLHGRISTDSRLRDHQGRFFVATRIEIVPNRTTSSNNTSQTLQKKQPASASAQKLNVHFPTRSEPTAEETAEFKLYAEKNTKPAWLEWLAKHPHSSYTPYAQYMVKRSGKSKDLFLEITNARPTGYRDCSHDVQRFSIPSALRLMRHRKNWRARCPTGMRFTYSFTNPSSRPVALEFEAFDVRFRTIVPAKSSVRKSALTSEACTVTKDPKISKQGGTPLVEFQCDTWKYKSFRASVIASDERAKIATRLLASTSSESNALKFAIKEPTSAASLIVVNHLVDIRDARRFDLGKAIKVTLHKGKRTGEVEPLPYSVRVKNNSKHSAAVLVRTEKGSKSGILWELAAGTEHKERYQTAPGKDPLFQVRAVYEPTPGSGLPDGEYHWSGKRWQERLIVFHDADDAVHAWRFVQTTGFGDVDYVVYYKGTGTKKSLQLEPIEARYRMYDKKEWDQSMDLKRLHLHQTPWVWTHEGFTKHGGWQTGSKTWEQRVYWLLNSGLISNSVYRDIKDSLLWYISEGLFVLLNQFKLFFNWFFVERNKRCGQQSSEGHLSFSCYSSTPTQNSCEINETIPQATVDPNACLFWFSNHLQKRLVVE